MKKSKKSIWIIEKFKEFAQRYGKTHGYNLIPGNIDKNDAFKHGFISAVGTMKFGPGITEVMGNAYEFYGCLDGQSPEERNMDYWNNAKGRAIGMTGTNYVDVALRVHQAIKAGDLIISTADKRSYYSLAISLRKSCVLNPAKKPLPFPKPPPPANPAPTSGTTP
jgi:hypothetical protein